MPLLFLLALALFTAPALASHQWGGVDICETRKDIMPPDMPARQLPEPGSAGALVLQRYCTQCHYLTGPGRHTREEWTDVLRRMDALMGISHFYRGLLGKVAMPDATEKAALRAYLDRHALKALPPPAPNTPVLGAERAWRALCGDCHAAPDPRAYPQAAWPALLARMEARRGVMARQPLTGAQKAAVEDYLAAAWGRPTVSGSGHQGATLALPGVATNPAEDPAGRWVSLAAFFGLAALGVWRWRRGRS
jgi:cytochrome c5